ncbi:MAG: polysaccharide deacetylase family protein [Deltaproteobacteria bacterium]|nr:polysaccharide deacetylase family protein [Deltaproteobacteria bacterium]
MSKRQHSNVQTPRSTPIVASVNFAHRFLSIYLYYSGKLEAHKNNRPQKWTILRYQRVIEPSRQPYPISVGQYVTPKTFEMHLRFLRKKCNVISLDSLLESLDNQKAIPKDTVVITIDDGYVDNYVYAFPLLQKHGLPATFFIPTSFIGSMDMFWPDKIMAAILTLFAHGVTFSQIDIIEKDFPDLFSSTKEDFSSTIAKTSILINLLKEVDPNERARIMAHIGVFLDEVGGFSMDRYFLNWHEVREMSSSPLVIFGSQGASHANYNELSPEEIIEDIRNSYLDFRANDITPTKVFCYPSGLFSKNNRQLLAKLGMEKVLAIGDFSLPQAENEKALKTLVLGRVQMFDSASFSNDLFACRIWRASAFGVPF